MAVSSTLDTMMGRAMRDADFRRNLLSDPVAAADAAGYSLSDEEREQLARLDRSKAESFFGRMESDDAPTAWCTDQTCAEDYVDV